MKQNKEFLNMLIELYKKELNQQKIIKESKNMAIYDGNLMAEKQRSQMETIIKAYLETHKD